MTAESFKRKLTAILSADVQGYSRLMGEDEEATVRTITAYREVITNLIEGRGGRVVDAKGDNILAEFSSVVDAVHCAVEVQKELAGRNAELPEHRRMEFRIGVNLGDVIEEGETIYGDGVNIAARLEGLADAGGICISGTAFEHIGKRLSVGYEYLGEQAVKNIDKPVRAYRVLMKSEHAGKVIGEGGKRPKRWARKALGTVIVLAVLAAGLVWNFYWRPPKMDRVSEERTAFPLPEKPSIAVLPFVNMSGDPNQEFFSDGITDNIITALAKVPNLFVIARNSTFVYKGKPVKIQQVAEDLGVRYVLEGSIQKADDKIRVTAQLIDAAKGHHIWSERYDRELKEIFALQDKLTLEILRNLDVKLPRTGAVRVFGKATDNLEAYLRFLQALALVNQWNRESNIRARPIAEEAIRLDPNFPAAYSALASINMMDVWLQISKSPRDSLMKAIELHQKALSLDDSFANSHAFLGFLYVQIREYEKGVAEAERAVEIAPNFADAYSLLAQVLNYSGRPEEAIVQNERAFRLNPLGRPSYYYLHAAHTHALTARHEDGVRICREGLSLYPDNALLHARLAMLYAAMGRGEEARDSVRDLLRIEPTFSAQRYAASMPYRDPALTDQALEWMRKAGLPD